MEQDARNFKINKSIEYITQKQIKQLKDWQSTIPDWNKNDRDMESYMQMVCAVTNESDDNASSKNLDTIKKAIGATTYIDINKY